MQSFKEYLLFIFRLFRFLLLSKNTLLHGGCSKMIFVIETHFSVNKLYNVPLVYSLKKPKNYCCRICTILCIDIHYFMYV